MGRRSGKGSGNGSGKAKHRSGHRAPGAPPPPTHRPAGAPPAQPGKTAGERQPAPQPAPAPAAPLLTRRLTRRRAIGILAGGLVVLAGGASACLGPAASLANRGTTSAPATPSTGPAEPTAAASPTPPPAAPTATTARPSPTSAPSKTPAREPAAAPTSTVGPTATAASAARPLGYLRAVGARLVDAAGEEVVLTGVNWFGMETGTYAPHGLWARNWEEMLDQVATLGYNVIRLPYSNQALDPNARPLEGIDFKLNPDLRGLNGLQIMDRLVQGAGIRGIKVILDRHRPTPAGQSKLWYTDEVPESQWIADWQMLAQRYRGNDTVIGADLHNEPAGDATWGSDDPRTDWRLAAERAGNAILAVNPDWLIVVEGVEKHRDERQQEDWFWMGGNLRGAARAPVRLSHPDKLVYSAHDYGPGVFSQGWFQSRDFPANLPGIWDTHWAYLVREGIAPVFVGEFGGRSVGQDAEGIWQRALVAFLKEHRISYAYWSLNPNSGDTGGILDDDWRSVHQAKQTLIASYQAPRLPVRSPLTVDVSAPVPARRKPLPSQALRALFRAGKLDALTEELALEFQVANRSDSRVPLSELVLSYWLVAPGADAAAQSISVDWASVDRKQLLLELQPDPRGGQTHRLDVSFGKEAGMVPAWGAAEIKLRLKRGDRGSYDQASAFSFRPANSYDENDRVALYFWGERVWGREPS